MATTTVSLVRTSVKTETWVRIAQGVLLMVVVTASFKPAEIFGPGEQFSVAAPAVDLLFRMVIFCACLFAVVVAFFTGRIQPSSLIFMPFLLWSMIVTVIKQSDFDSARQLGSYAVWMFAYIAIVAFWRDSGAYKRLTNLFIISVFLSAAGGELQYLLGYAPGLGHMWPESAETEVLRVHTGSGGILLDAFVPYCAGILLMSIAGNKRWKHVAAWALLLWGTANTLRGGIIALFLGLTWFLLIATKETRKQILPFLTGGLVCAVLLFGATIAAKTSMSGAGRDETVNTSGRMDSWPQFIRWIEEEPILGHGPDADMELIDKSAYSDIRASHNEILSTGINFGVVGVLLLWIPLVWIVGDSVRKTFKAVGRRRDEVGAAAAILLMILFLSLTDNTLRTPGVMIIALAPYLVGKWGEQELAEGVAA